jgi:hypothetical protein
VSSCRWATTKGSTIPTSAIEATMRLYRIACFMLSGTRFIGRIFGSGRTTTWRSKAILTGSGMSGFR